METIKIKRLEDGEWEVIVQNDTFRIVSVKDVLPIMKWKNGEILYAGQTNDFCTLILTFDPDGSSYSLLETTLNQGEEIGILVDKSKITPDI